MIWPRLITRYVTVELLKFFLLALTVFTFLIMFVGLGQEAIRHGVGPIVVLRFIPYLLPNALVFALPATLLFSSCSVYGRMSAANEIVALKSLGISPSVVFQPALVLGVFVSFLSVWLIDVAYSWGYEGVQRIVMNSVEEIAYGVLRAERTYTTKQFSITVARVDDTRFVRPTITIHPSDGDLITMMAREGELQRGADEGTLKLILTDGVIHRDNTATFRFPNTIEYVIRLDDQDAGGAAMSPSHMRLRQIPEALKDQRQRIARLEQASAAEAAYQLLNGDFRALTDTRWHGRCDELDHEREQLFRMKTEPHRRWASGFSCICFLFVGMPLAIRLKNADFVTTFGICFLPILIVYYPFFVFGLERAKEGTLPPYCVWLGNVFCILVGVWFLRKVMRY